MKILFSPQVNDEKIHYTFEKDKVIANYKEKTDTFDFTSFGQGKLQIFDDETGNELVETNLDIQPIRSAERKSDGILYVELLHFIPMNATENERFPKWIDHTGYVVPEPVEVEEEIAKETVEEPVEEGGEVSG